MLKISKDFSNRWHTWWICQNLRIHITESICSVILRNIVELELIGCQDIRQIQGHQSIEGIPIKVVRYLDGNACSVILRNIGGPDKGCEESGVRISGRFRGTKVQSISDIMDVQYLDENISSMILYKIVELEFN